MQSNTENIQQWFQPMSHHGAAELNGQKCTPYWELGTQSRRERRNLHVKCRPGRAYWEWEAQLQAPHGSSIYCCHGCFGGCAEKNCSDCSKVQRLQCNPISPIGLVVQQRDRDWTLKIENLVENGQEILKDAQGAVHCSHLSRGIML